MKKIVKISKSLFSDSNRDGDSYDPPSLIMIICDGGIRTWTCLNLCFFFTIGSFKVILSGHVENVALLISIIL